eukprot:6213168-Pleurochrysis_carterae.AAC.2
MSIGDVLQLGKDKATFDHLPILSNVTLRHHVVLTILSYPDLEKWRRGSESDVDIWRAAQGVVLMAGHRESAQQNHAVEIYNFATSPTPGTPAVTEPALARQRTEEVPELLRRRNDAAACDAIGRGLRRGGRHDVRAPAAAWDTAEGARKLGRGTTSRHISRLLKARSMSCCRPFAGRFAD